VHGLPDEHGRRGEPLEVGVKITKLTTEQATDWLACRLDFPLADGHRAEDALRAAIRHGEAWDWTQAGRCLSMAYVRLGSSSPYADHLSEGTAWHRGEHPIQVTARALDDVEARDLRDWALARPWVWS
jgi:hypothetical protein